MAKPRRIAFTTLHSAPSSSFRLSGRDGGDQPRDSLSAEPTVRISVPLFQPHDQRYPEFYYPDLVESARQEGEVDPWGGKVSVLFAAGVRLEDERCITEVFFLSFCCLPFHYKYLNVNIIFDINY